MQKLRRIRGLAALALCFVAAALPVRADDLSVVPVPAAGGSVGPNIAVSSGGHKVLSWLEPAGDQHALRYSVWRDDAWQAPRTVASGSNWFVNWADFPSVVPVTDSFWTAHWLVRRPAGGYAYDVYVAVSQDAGESWSKPRPAHDDDTDTEHGFVSTFESANGAGLVWLDGRRTGSAPHGTGEAMAGMTLRTAVLTPQATLEQEQELDGLICDCCQTDVTVSRDGPVAVYRDRTPDEVRDIYIARNIDGEWRAGTPVAKDGWVIPGCPVNGPVVASSGSTVVVAWFTAADNQPRVRLARSDGPDEAFSEPLDIIPDKAAGRVGLALLEDGSSVVSALRSVGGGLAELLLTHVSEDGEIGEPFVVASGLPAFSVPQLASEQDDLLLVYTQREDDRTVLRGKRIPVSSL